jgi:hypothetical protein
VLIAFFFFIFSCSSENSSQLLFSFLQIEQKNPFLASSKEPLSDPLSFKILLEILSPFWKRTSKSDFAIRSYSRPPGILANGAYVGGVFDPINNQIVFVPSAQASQSEWHIYDCRTQRIVVYLQPAEPLADGAYQGGVFDPINNQILTT